MSTRSSACMATSTSSGRYQPISERSVPVRWSRPMSTLSMTLARFTRLNVWKIMPMCERSSRSWRDEAPRTLTPSTMTSPEVSGTRPLMARMSVDLPAPERPTMTTIWPSGISRSRSRSAATPPGYVTEARSNRITGSQMVRRAGPAWTRPPNRLLGTVAQLLDGITDDLERVEVRLAEGRDVVDRIEDGLALRGGCEVEECLLDGRLELRGEVPRDGHAVVGDLRTVGEDDDRAGHVA